MPALEGQKEIYSLLYSYYVYSKWLFLLVLN